MTRLAPLLILLLAATPSQAQQADAADKKLMAANGLFERQLYDMALQEYGEFLETYPDHPRKPDARYGRALSLYKLDRHADAANILADLATNVSFDRREEALAVIAHCYQTTGDYNKALDAIDTLTSGYPDTDHAETALLNRAQVLYMLDRKQQSADAARAFINRFDESDRLASAYYFLALAEFDLEHNDKAAAALDTLIADYPESPQMLDAILLLGRTYERQGKREEASKHYQRLIDQSGGAHQAASHYTLGVAFHKVEDYARAEQQLRAVLDQYPNSEQAAPARMQLGLTQLAAGKHAEARATFNDVAARDAQRKDTARFWHAQVDIAAGQFAAALDTLTQLGKQNPPPDNLEAVQFDRGVCLMSLERYDEAAAHFASLAEQYPDSNERAEIIHRRAFSLHKLEKYQQSLELCRTLARMPQSPIIEASMELTAENLFLLEDYNAAAGVYEDLIHRVDDNRQPRYAFRLGQCAFFNGDYPRAADRLRQLLARDDLDAALRREATFLLGDAQLQAGDYTAAEQTLDRFVKDAGADNFEARFKHALAMLRRGNRAEAQASLETLAAQDATSPWVQRAMFEFGQLAYQNKQYPAARDALTKLLRAAPPDALAASAQYLIGWIDFDRQHYDASAAAFDQFVAQHPKHKLAPDAAYQSAAALEKAGHADKALAKLDKLITDYPDVPEAAEARYLRTVCLAALGKHHEAAAALSDLASTDRADRDAILYDLAWTYRDMEQPDDAIAAYHKLLDQHAGSDLAAPTRTELAELLYLKEQYADAAAVLERVSDDPGADPQTWAIAKYRLGFSYSKLNQHVRAANVFQMFTQRMPDHALAPSAMYQAGVSLIEANALPQATELFTELRAAHPDHDLAPAALLKLGELAAARQAYDESIALYQQYLEAHGDSEFAYLAQFGLGWAHENSGNHDAARDWYNKVIANHNGPTAARAQFQVGETFFAQNDHARAAKELLKVDIVYAYPQWSAPALLEAGRAFEQLGQHAKARTQYRQCIDRFPDREEAALAKQRLDALPQ